MLVVAGGKGSEILDSTELFNSANGQWYTTNNLPEPCFGLQSVIADNILYVFVATISL